MYVTWPEIRLLPTGGRGGRGGGGGGGVTNTVNEKNAATKRRKVLLLRVQCKRLAQYCLRVGVLGNTYGLHADGDLIIRRLQNTD